MASSFVLVIFWILQILTPSFRSIWRTVSATSFLLIWAQGLISHVHSDEQKLREVARPRGAHEPQLAEDLSQDCAAELPEGAVHRAPR